MAEHLADAVWKENYGIAIPTVERPIENAGFALSCSPNKTATNRELVEVRQRPISVKSEAKDAAERTDEK